MKFFILSGSHRAEAQTLKVANYAKSVLLHEHAGAEIYLYSLSGNPLPLWDEASGGAPDAIWDPISAELKAADTLVILTPEWSGMATPGVKNFLLNCTADEIGHKPALIVTVSASRGGSYPVAELRMSGYKNNRLNWIPEHVIVHHAEQNFTVPDGAADITKEDALLRKRLRYALKVLEEYGKALKQVRASGVVDHKTFRSGCCATKSFSQSCQNGWPKCGGRNAPFYGRGQIGWPIANWPKQRLANRLHATAAWS